jgi:hypothetical protein
MRLTAVTALALVCVPRSVLAQGSCSSRDTARTREELVGVYNTFREAFMNNAPQAWIDALAPSFTLTLFDGKVMSKDWVENYVRTNAAQFRIRTLAMVVQSITRLVDTVVATVEQTSDREYSDEQGVRHRLEVGALQLETWVCTGAGWRLTNVKEHKLLYLRRDGQSSQ